MSVTIHHGTSFVVSDEVGDITPDDASGYFHLDTRFLSCHALRIEGLRPVVLQAFVPNADEAWHVLTNPALDAVPRSTLGMTVHRLVGGGLREEIEVENFSGGDARCELQLRFAADFAYILTVKKEAGGGEGAWRPDVRASLDGGREVRFELAGAQVARQAAVSFAPSPSKLTSGEACFALRLAPRERWRAVVEVTPSIGDERVHARPVSRGRARATRERRRELGSRLPRVETDHEVLARAFDQASRDLAALRIKADGSAGDDGGGGEYAIAAGIPWYMDLFGRDSLIASYATMLHDPALARGTLEALACLQGKEVDRVSEEAPGKILHEYRRGPLTPAARKLIPTYPYYGTIDATPLFLVTLSEYVRVTGDLAFARGLWGHVEARSSGCDATGTATATGSSSTSGTPTSGS